MLLGFEMAGFGFVMRANCSDMVRFRHVIIG